MNPSPPGSVHEMSLLVGQLAGKLESLITSVNNLDHKWGERERDAVTGRRMLHEKFEVMNRTLGTVQAEVSNVANEVFSLKPHVEKLRSEHEQHLGAKRLSKSAWSVLIGVSGLTGGGFAEILHRLLR